LFLSLWRDLAATLSCDLGALPGFASKLQVLESRVGLQRDNESLAKACVFCLTAAKELLHVDVVDGSQVAVSLFRSCGSASELHMPR
jgi:hypothetical protein